MFQVTNRGLDGMTQWTGVVLSLILSSVLDRRPHSLLLGPFKVYGRLVLRLAILSIQLGV